MFMRLKHLPSTMWAIILKNNTCCTIKAKTECFIIQLYGYYYTTFKTIADEVTVIGDKRKTKAIIFYYQRHHTEWSEISKINHELDNTTNFV